MKRSLCYRLTNFFMAMAIAIACVTTVAAVMLPLQYPATPVAK